MRGARENYGKAGDGRAMTLRVYGYERLFVEKESRALKISVQDFIVRLIKEARAAREQKP